MLSGLPPFLIHVLLSYGDVKIIWDMILQCQSTFHLESVRGKQSEEDMCCVAQHKKKPTSVTELTVSRVFKNNHWCLRDRHQDSMSELEYEISV